MTLYMAEINKYNFNDNAVTCIIVNDNPWFKAKEVTTILGYATTKQAIIKQVDDDDKQTIEQLLDTMQVKGLSDRPLKANEKATIFTN